MITENFASKFDPWKKHAGQPHHSALPQLHEGWHELAKHINCLLILIVLQS
jgi:hypothetical protein